MDETLPSVDAGRTTIFDGGDESFDANATTAYDGGATFDANATTAYDAGSAPLDTSATVVTPAPARESVLFAAVGAATPVAQPGPAAAVISAEVPPTPAPSPVRFGGEQASHAPAAPPVKPPSGGVGGDGLFNRLPRRIVEIGVAVAAAVVLLGVLAYAVAANGDDGNGNGGGIAAGDDGARGEAGDNGANLDPAAGRGGDGAGGGQGVFVPGRTETTATTETSTDAEPTTTTTTDENETTTTTEEENETTTTTVEEKETTTTTEEENETTTTTEEEKETTTTTEEEVVTPPTKDIKIVSGPTVGTVGPTSFHFNYSTNDVCGTGSFTVTEKSSGKTIGSFTGANVCYGPLHGGFPQANHAAFGGFIMEPNTTYRVSIKVRGTASDGDRPAGSGVATASFDVTTTS